MAPRTGGKPVVRSRRSGMPGGGGGRYDGWPDSVPPPLLYAAWWCSPAVTQPGQQPGQHHQPGPRDEAPASCPPRRPYPSLQGGGSLSLSGKYPHNGTGTKADPKCLKKRRSSFGGKTLVHTNFFLFKRPKIVQKSRLVNRPGVPVPIGLTAACSQSATSDELCLPMGAMVPILRAHTPKVPKPVF